MEREGETTGPGRRTWSFVLAGLWALLGTWSFSAGDTWVGLAQLALGVAFLASAQSRRVAAWDEAPLFRWK